MLLAVNKYQFQTISLNFQLNLSADNGHAEASNEIAVIYFKGENVPLDLYSCTLLQECSKSRIRSFNVQLCIDALQKPWRSNEQKRSI